MKYNNLQNKFGLQVQSHMKCTYSSEDNVGIMSMSTGVANGGRLANYRTAKTIALK